MSSVHLAQIRNKLCFCHSCKYVEILLPDRITLYQSFCLVRVHVSWKILMFQKRRNSMFNNDSHTVLMLCITKTGMWFLMT